jgi:hypothetical protein
MKWRCKKIWPSWEVGFKLVYLIIASMRLLWQNSQTRNQVTLRGVENSDFIFMPAGSDVYLCLSTEQRIHKIFKRQCRASDCKNVLRLWCPNQ